ncbi:hypothetical protein L917_00973 [Phytophthora nicotianae]|uniref:Uncharacterized protein n=1 Tax=Phytophthora nicotianae TaxID=4792 RepID=W2LYN9_PHYNI|nr:hypothetical protein L917_00973 [Phytophthora nicotianae]ETM55841.1 hypothetical protein L914_01011 [Phytophthora nicotianae]
MRLTTTTQKQGDANESTTLARIPWDADSPTPDGLTSLDVLLKWMVTPGKYERLHGDQRSRAIQSVLGALKRNGIEHRTESSVRGKVRSIENQYLSAKQWLKERDINGNDVTTGNVDSDTETAVLSLCPHFSELVPIFRDSSYLNTMASARYQVEVTEDNREKPARLKDKRKTRKEVHRPGKRRLVQTTEVKSYAGVHEDEEEDRDEVARVLNCVRRTTYGNIPGNELDLSGDSQLPSEDQRQIAEIKVNHVKKQSQAVLEHEDKMRAEMLECDVEVKRGRGEVQLLLERMLARQTMRKDGIPNDEIDVVLPLKEL